MRNLEVCYYNSTTSNYLKSKDIFKPKTIKQKEEISYKVLKLVPVLEQVLILLGPTEVNSLCY